MSQWIRAGLRTGIKTTAYPAAPETAPGVSPGLPVGGPHPRDAVAELIARCPTGAISASDAEAVVDARRCVHCYRCRRGVATPLEWADGYEWATHGPTDDPHRQLGPAFRRSAHVIVVDAGDCGACLNEVKQLAGPYYNMHRLGFFLTPTPRHADVLLVVGPVTDHMRIALLKTWEAMPAPKRVRAVGRRLRPELRRRGRRGERAAGGRGGARTAAPPARHPARVAHDGRARARRRRQMSAFTAWLAAVGTLCGAGIVLGIALPARHAPRVIALLGTLAALATLGLGAHALSGGAPAATAIWTIPAAGDVVLHADALSALFLLVTGVVILAASIFIATSLPPILETYSGRAFAVLYFGLVASVVWVLVASDVFSFFVAWEIMSIVSYLLVLFEHEQEANRRAGYLMLAMSEAGALAALLGFLLLAAHAGSQDFAHMRTAAPTLDGDIRLAILLLTLFGFGVKAGLVPVNAWLPRAYTAAPAPFVPVLAGATLNLGLYGIFRVNADLVSPTSVLPGVVTLVVGTLSALLGILHATTDGDLKTLLAHSSIENAGIITAGFGAGLVFAAAGRPVLSSVAFLVALYHLVNHALFKTLLFVSAGVVEQRAGTRDLDRLGGLVRRMRWTALAALVGVLSIAAMPPFNGFVSEWLTLQTLLRSAELASVGVKVIFALCGAGLALTAALAVTCFAKVFAMGFLGMARSAEADEAREA